MRNFNESSRALIVTLALLVSTTAAVGTATPAEAQVNAWYGTVDRVLDGDTFEINWAAGSQHPEGKNRIRLLGVDTNEVSNSECLADEATAALETLIPPGTPVRMEARDLYSETLERPLRHVFVGSGWQTNVATELVSQGLGLAAGYDIEPDYREEYYAAAEAAMANEVGLWQPGVCGGIALDPSFEMLVNYDAAGDDQSNLNDEYIQLRNTGSSPLDLTGWSFRSSARLDGSTETISSGTVHPGRAFRIHVGSGTNTATDQYLGYSEPWFDNDVDVLYLRDEHLNIRAAQFWPCTTSCGDLETVVIEQVQYDAPGNDLDNPNGEWLKLRNRSAASIDLTDWRIKDDGADYVFGDAERLAAGESLTVYIGPGVDSGQERYWGKGSGILNNTSGEQKLELQNPESQRVDCFSWGASTCEDEPVHGAIAFSVNYNAAGNDVTNPNGEWVALLNTSDSTVDLSGHKVYSPGHTYVFPSGTTLAPNHQLRLRVGSGNNSSFNHYWGKSSGIFSNSGDYAQLRSSDNKVIFESRWPCSAGCGSGEDLASEGIVIDSVNYDAAGDDRTNPNGEWIVIRNASSAPRDLRNWKVVVGGYQYVSLASRPMEPGDTVKLWVGGGRNTTSEMFWGKTKGILLNSGARSVVLMSPARQVVDCHSWGSASCMTQSVPAGVDLSANYDAAGTDSSNPNGEWVNLANTSSSAISLDGYHLYTDGTRYYFEGGDVVSPGDRLQVKLGYGNDSHNVRHADAVLNELANSADEVELRRNDSARSVSFVNWPCSPSCPASADLSITQVNYDAAGNDATNPNGEWITIKNNGSKAADLRDWRIQYKTGTFYDFSQSAVLAPGATLQLFVGPGVDAGGDVFWQHGTGLLSNSGGDVTLWTPHREVRDTFSW